MKRWVFTPARSFSKRLGIKWTSIASLHLRGEGFRLLRDQLNLKGYSGWLKLPVISLSMTLRSSWRE